VRVRMLVVERIWGSDLRVAPYFGGEIGVFFGDVAAMGRCHSPCRGRDDNDRTGILPCRTKRRRFFTPLSLQHRVRYCSDCEHWRTGETWRHGKGQENRKTESLTAKTSLSVGFCSQDPGDFH